MNDILNKFCSGVRCIFDYLEKWQLLRPFELAFLAVVCFIAGRILGGIIGWGNTYFSGFWVMLVAFLVTRDEKIDISELQNRLLAVALGIIAGFVVLSVFNTNLFAFFVSVALVAWACAFFNWHKFQQLAILALTVLVVSQYLAGLEVFTTALWLGALGRVVEAAIGMLLAYGTHYLFTYIKECCHQPTD